MFDLTELSALRSSLDVITIKGADAKMIAALQDKIETYIVDLQEPPSPRKKRNSSK